MNVFAIFWFVIAVCFSANIVSSDKTIPPAKVFDVEEEMWYYEPDSLIEKSRERTARGLAITCQSNTLCGVRRSTDENATGTHIATQYCDCPEGEECRRIEVIEPSNFTYFRCMDI